MPTTQAKAALRRYRRDNGFCIHCGKTADNGTRCLVCTEKDKANRKKYRERDLLAGVCGNLGCKNAVRPGRSQCQACSVVRSNREKKRAADRICKRCPRAATRNSRFCERHAEMACEAMRKFREKRIAEGKCVNCGTFILSGTQDRCEECAEKAIEYHRKRKIEVMDAYGGPICVGCGLDEVLILQMDHINGGGHKHAKEIGGRGKIYQWLRKNNFPPGFRVLCPNCNTRAARGLPFPNDLRSKPQCPPPP